MKRPIEGALDQLSTEVNSRGEIEHYLWGFEDDYDSTVLISQAAYDRIQRFLLEGSGNELHDIDGVMATERDPDEDSIPFGARVNVTLCMEDRHSDESAWFFHIERADVKAVA